MIDSKGITWVQAKTISVGEQFKLSPDSRTYTRVQASFPLRSRRDWDRSTGSDGGHIPSNDHVLAVNEIHQLTAVHPDNHVIPIAALTFDAGI